MTEQPPGSNTSTQATDKPPAAAWRLESAEGCFMAVDETQMGRLVGLLDVVAWLQTAHKLPRQAVAQMVAESLPADAMNHLYVVRPNQYAEPLCRNVTFGFMPMAVQGYAIAKLETEPGATFTCESAGISTTFRTSDELRRYCRPVAEPGLAALRQALVADALAGLGDVPRCSRVAVRLSLAQELWGYALCTNGKPAPMPDRSQGPYTDPTRLLPHLGWQLHSEFGYMGRDATPAGRLVRLADLVRWLMDRERIPRAEALARICEAITPELMPYLYMVSSKGESASLVSPESGFGYATPKSAEASKARARQLASERVWQSVNHDAAGGFVTQTTGVRITQIGSTTPPHPVQPGAVALVKRMKACWACPKLGRQSTCDSLDDPKSRIERVAILMTKAHELWEYGQPVEPQAPPATLVAAAEPVHPSPALVVDQFAGIADELRPRLTALLQQRGKTAATKGKKGPKWTGAQLVTAADVVEALDNLQSGTGMATLAGALGVTRQTLEGALSADTVKKARTAQRLENAKALSSQSSVFALGAAKSKGT
jgi:hypothetical protein